MKEKIAQFKQFMSLRVIMQWLNPKKIPFIILNYNQLYFPKKLVEFATKRGFKTIVIIDNSSTYPPLLDYYKTLEQTNVIVELLNNNYGHLVLLENDTLYNKYCKGFFIYTDADIVPNPKLPSDFLDVMLKVLLRKRSKITKVGFALNISNLPEHYPAKKNVIKWENQFWESKIEDNLYYANIDTTFALYKPNPKKYFSNPKDRLLAIRMAGDYTCEHMGWHIDYNNLTDEQEYFRKNATGVSSWLINESGKINYSEYD